MATNSLHKSLALPRRAWERYGCRAGWPVLALRRPGLGGDLYADIPVARFQVKERELMAEAPVAQSHSSSTRFYWMVAAVLAVITIVEVVVSLNGVLVDQENPDPTTQLVLLAILLVLAAVKGAGVVMFFMHLRGDARVYQLLFIAPFALASSMIVVFLALFSNFVGIGGEP